MKTTLLFQSMDILFISLQILDQQFICSENLVKTQERDRVQSIFPGKFPQQRYEKDGGAPIVWG